LGRLCYTYLELSKVRGESFLKVAIYVFRKALDLLAPIAPFISEELYHLLYKQKENCESIHLCGMEELKLDFRDEYLKKGEELKKLIEAIEKYKTERKIKLRDPIEVVEVSGINKGLVEEFLELVKAYYNIGKIEWKG